MDRKEMIKQLSEHFGMKPKYLSVPSFAYEITTENEVYTIDTVSYTHLTLPTKRIV